MFRARYGSFQSTGSPPSSSSNALARLNGREPKKPRSADIGLGCADSMQRDVAEQRSEVAGVAAPQDRHERFAVPVDERADRLLRDGLPALAAVRARLPRRHGEHPVEQQHALLGPRREVAGGGRRVAEVGGVLAEDVGAGCRGTGRTSGATENDSPTACPGVGYGSWPTISTRTVANGLVNARSTFAPAGRYRLPAAISARRKSPMSATLWATGASACAHPASTTSVNGLPAISPASAARPGTAFRVRRSW